MNTEADYITSLPTDFLEPHSLLGRNSAPFLEHEDYGYMPLPEQILWKNVIIQGILDAALQPNSRKARSEKTKAIIWLSMQNKDFLMVCELASLSPSEVIRSAKQYIKRSSVVYKRKSHMKRLRSNKQGGALKQISMPEASRTAQR